MKYQEFKDRFVAEMVIISECNVEGATMSFEAAFQANEQGEAIDLDGELVEEPEEAAYDEVSSWEDDEGEEDDDEEELH